MKMTVQSSSSPAFTRDINFSGKESIGQRENQEDFSLFRIMEGGNQLLAVMADGMGGHASGEVASKKAVDAFNQAFASYPSHQIASKLAVALQQANFQIAQAIREMPALDGMGCTLIAASVSADGLYWISVGDSLLLLIRGKKIQRINADHSMMALIRDSVKSGKMSDAEAKNYPYKNALRSAVTGGDIALIDSPSAPLKLHSGDIVILATDGILSLGEDEILDIVRANKSSPADQIAARLIKAVEAKNRPKQDNTSAQVIVVPAQISKKVGHLRVALLLGLLGAIGVFAATYYAIDTAAVDIRSSVESVLKAPEIKQPQPTAIPVENNDVISPSSENPVNADSQNGKAKLTHPQKTTSKQSPQRASNSKGTASNAKKPIDPHEADTKPATALPQDLKPTAETARVSDEQ